MSDLLLCFKTRRLKGDWCRKSKPTLAVFDPVKFKEVWAKFLSTYFKFSQDTTADILLTEFAGRAGRLEVVKKETDTCDPLQLSP